MPSRKRLANLSSYALARMLMTKLWRIYDTSGVSMGRSVRSALLESITNILPHVQEEAGIHVDKVDTWDLCGEAIRRAKRKKLSEVQLDLFLSLPYLSDCRYSCLVLQAIVDWYKKDAQEERYPLTSEARIAEAIFNSTSVSEQISQHRKLGMIFTVSDLVEEGRSRFRAKMLEERKETELFW